MMKDVKNLMLLAKVYETIKKGEDVLATLNKVENECKLRVFPHRAC